MTDAAAHFDHARALLRRHPIIDGHNDLPWQVRSEIGIDGDLAAYDISAATSGQTDLPRLRAGGVGGQFWSVFVPGDLGGGHARLQREQIGLARRLIERHAGDLAFCCTADEVEAAIHDGRVASLLGMEGGHVLEGSLDLLREFHALGARYLTLTHFGTNDLADSATDDPRHDGLSALGREVVAEMNRLGMLVDLSHVAPSTMHDALDATRAPVIFSHSSARAVCDVPRNVPDEVLARLPANGGICMVTFVAGFISRATADVLEPIHAEVKRRSDGRTDATALRRIREELLSGVEVPVPTVGDVADHVEHVASVAGRAHVGIGGDYDGSMIWPRGLEDVSGYPLLFAELLARGWSEPDLAALANGNILRVMRAAEAVAAS